MTDPTPTPTPRTPRRRGRLAVVAALAASFLGASAFAALRPASADEGPEISLKAGDRKVIVTDRPMGSSALGENGPSQPSDCIDDPTIALVCDAYRLHVDLDPNAEALNFVTLRLDFDTPTAPALTAVAAGFTAINAGDLDIGVWDMSGEKPVLMAVAGAGEPYSVPEIAAFEPTMTDYMVTVESTRAPIVGYTLTASFSNELFSTPFEALDPSLTGPEDRSSVRPVDSSGDGTIAPAAPALPATSFDDLTPPPEYASAALAPVAPIAADSDFAGFRTAVDDSLAAPQISAASASVVIPKPKHPSASLLVFWLLIVPLLLLGFVAAALRRRRPTALQG
jgi:hypothetical protein